MDRLPGVCYTVLKAADGLCNDRKYRQSDDGQQGGKGNNLHTGHRVPPKLLGEDAGGTGHRRGGQKHQGTVESGRQSKGQQDQRRQPRHQD